MLGPPVVTILCVVERILLIHECALHKKNSSNVQCVEIWNEKKWVHPGQFTAYFKFFSSLKKGPDQGKVRGTARQVFSMEQANLTFFHSDSIYTQYGDCPRKKGCPIVGKSPSSSSVVHFFGSHDFNGKK